MIAILTDRVERAISQLKAERTIDEYSTTRRRGTFCSGREFVVVTLPEHLDGVRLKDYRVIGNVDNLLIDHARARMVG